VFEPGSYKNLRKKTRGSRLRLYTPFLDGEKASCFAAGEEAGRRPWWATGAVHGDAEYERACDSPPATLIPYFSIVVQFAKREKKKEIFDIIAQVVHIIDQLLVDNNVRCKKTNYHK
jgi:hypothetical protein